MSDWLDPALKASLGALSDAQLVALVLAGEARSEPIEGIVGVANAIRNRVRAQGWYGDSYPEVVTKPWQFSCLSVKGGKGNFQFVKALAKQFAEKQPITEPKVKQCIGVATLLLADQYLLDNTRGSTHYCVYTLSPEWAKGHKPAVRLGAHHFFNDVT